MNIKTCFRYICLIFVILICTFIFLVSGNDGQTSTEISGSFIEVIIRFFNKNFDSLSETERFEIIASCQHFVRKTAHFTIYAALGFFTVGFLRTYNLFKTIKASLFSVLFVLIYAVSDEIHQLFIPMRSGQVSDVFLDTFGGIFGVIIMNVLFLIAAKIMEAINEVKK